MKQMKFFLAAVMAVVMGMSVTSCMKDSESAYDIGVYASVVDDITSVTLLGDDGNAYYPVNPNALKANGETSYPKRVFVYLKYAEGVTAESAKKNVTIVQYSSLYTRSLCLRPDTIKADLPLAGLTDFGVVNASTVTMFDNVPAYCNVVFSIYIDNSAAVVDLVPVTATGNELTVKLQQTVGNKDAVYQTTGYASFSIPSVGEINAALALARETAEGEETSETPTLVPEGGKIKIKIIGTGKNQNYDLSSKEVKISNY